MSTYVIAELGACHDGSFDAMLKGIRVAKGCGADAVKLQWTSDPIRMARRRGKALEDGYGEVYERYLAWPARWHERLRAECDAVGIDYMCTVYLLEDVEVIAPFVRHFKISSFEADDLRLWLRSAKEATNSDRWVIGSAGMGQLVSIAERWMCARTLHCVSAYPAPHAALNLRGGKRDGLSDHTAPHLLWTGALAVAAGAEIIEAHFRLDTTEPENPDFPHAMDPHQFAQYIANIRFAEECMGTGETGMHECEKPMSRYKITASGATTADQQDVP